MKVVERMLDWENAGRIDLLKTGYSLRAPELLFRKIEDEEIQKQMEKLHQNAVKPNAVMDEVDKANSGQKNLKFNLRILRNLNCVQVLS